MERGKEGTVTAWPAMCSLLLLALLLSSCRGDTTSQPPTDPFTSTADTNQPTTPLPASTTPGFSTPRTVSEDVITTGAPKTAGVSTKDVTGSSSPRPISMSTEQAYTAPGPPSIIVDGSSTHPDSRTEGPSSEEVVSQTSSLSRTDSPPAATKAGDEEAIVSTSVRNVVAEPVLFATSPPKVVTIGRPLAQPLLQATTPRAQISQQTTLLTNTLKPNKQQEINDNHIQRKGGIKIKRPKKKDSGMSSLLYIPLMIQAQIIPMMLIKLKFLALKALTIGKLALLLVGLNILRNAMLGHENDAEQYEHETLASQHYGYNGGPEYGSWVNRRLYNGNHNNDSGERYKPTTYAGFQNRRVSFTEATSHSSSILELTSSTHKPFTLEAGKNNPYRGHLKNNLKSKRMLVLSMKLNRSEGNSSPT